MAKYHFPVVITQDNEGIYFARVSSLPGCHTQAATLPALYKRIEEAIGLCLAVQKTKNQYISQDKFVGIQEIYVTA